MNRRVTAPILRIMTLSLIILASTNSGMSQVGNNNGVMNPNRATEKSCWPCPTSISIL
jgi:hypothetical protein